MKKRKHLIEDESFLCEISQSLKKAHFEMTVRLHSEFKSLSVRVIFDFLRKLYRELF